MNITKAFDKNECFFTSDNHFKHANVIGYCNRPFPDVDTMDDELMRRWNMTVPTTGKVFIAGDMIHSGNIEYIKDLLDKLNGEKYFIFGNHCYKNRFDRKSLSNLFTQTADVMSIRIKDAENAKLLNIEKDSEYVRFFISHYPHLYWERYTIHLHGHVHSGPLTISGEQVPFHPLRYDIGCDNNDFTPISYNKLIDIIFSRLNINKHDK